MLKDIINLMFIKLLEYYITISSYFTISNYPATLLKGITNKLVISIEKFEYKNIGEPFKLFLRYESDK